MTLLDARPVASPEARTVVVATRRSHRSRTVIVSVALAMAIVAAFCVSVSVGDFPIPLADVVPAIFGFGDPSSSFIVGTLRLPRALTGVLVGAAFGLSGAIFQSLARNPLASPDIIGITAGASAAAVFVIVIGDAHYLVVSLAALAGALATALAMYLLAYKRGISSYRLVLVGIGMAAVLRSVISYLLTRTEIYRAEAALVWLTGSLNARGWEHVVPVAGALAFLFPVVILLARPLRALQLGDDTAKGLGAPVESARSGLILTAVGLAAVATASAGPVAFVAFVAAPIARRLTETSLALLPTALVGALIVLLSDLVGRRIVAPTELPVGIITGIIGGPYLLWLLARANRIGKGG
jgi:iron complex transport system permease protein